MTGRRSKTLPQALVAGGGGEGIKTMARQPRAGVDFVLDFIPIANCTRLLWEGGGGVGEVREKVEEQEGSKIRLDCISNLKHQ